MKFERKKSTALPRQRPVTGGQRPTAFSYHANRAEQEYNLGRLQSRDQDTRRRERLVRYWRQRLGMLLAGVALIVCVLNVLHLSPTPTVIALTSSSSNSFLQPTHVYQTAAQKLFASSILNANKVTINTAAIQAQLKQKFPELSDVSITLPLMGHQPVVYIAPTTPSLLLKTKTDEFVLNTSGRALLSADQVQNLDTLKLPLVSDQSDVQINTGTIALPSSSVSFIQTVVRELQAKNIAIESLTLPAAAAYELDVKPRGVGYFVKFNMHADTALQQSGTFLAVQQRLSAQGITPGSYIDVRLDGRAYYK